MLMSRSTKSTNQAKKRDDVTSIKSVKSLDDFNQLEQVATGSYSVVYSGVFNKTKYAIKQCVPDKFGQELEIGRLAACNKLLNAIVPAIHHVFADEDSDDDDNAAKVNLVMDFIDGQTLESVILTDDIAVKISVCLILARNLDLLHHMGIVHLDLKPNNIIYNKKTKQLMFVDFGFACLQPEDDPTGIDEPCLVQMKGSPDFMSPELYLINYHRTPKIVDAWKFAMSNDVWAVAIIMVLILNGGYVPYRKNHRPVDRTGKRIKPLQHRTKNRMIDHLIAWIESTVFEDKGHVDRVTAKQFADQLDVQIGKHATKKKRRKMASL